MINQRHLTGAYVRGRYAYYERSYHPDLELLVWVVCARINGEIYSFWVDAPAKEGALTIKEIAMKLRHARREWRHHIANGESDGKRAEKLRVQLKAHGW